MTKRIGVTIKDPFWNRYKLYQTVLLEIGQKPLSYQTWLKRFEKHSPGVTPDEN